MTKALNPEYLDEYAQWLQLKGLSKNTIKGYTNLLKIIPEDIEAYFANPHLKSKNSKVCAYRSYLRFLCRKKKLLSRGDLLDALDTFRPPKRITNGYSKRKWSVPRKQWEEYIRQAPNQVAKMGIWVGFQFGMRLGEIIHLRIQDIDFQHKEIHLREHTKKKNQETWKPKYNRERRIPFTNEQGKIFKK